MISRKNVCMHVLLAHALLASQNSASAFIPSPSQVSSCSPARRLVTGVTISAPRYHVHPRMNSLHGALRDIDELSLNAMSDRPVGVASSLIIPHSSIGGTALLSNSGDGSGDILSSITSVLAIGIVIAAAIFLYANVVYTPEIIENAQAMRQEEQAAQILALVRQLREEEEKEEGRAGTTMDNKGANARDALEKVFGMSIQKYVDHVEGRIRSKDINSKSESIAVSDAEKELVTILRSLYL